MLFLILNILIASFFLFLIIVGVILKYYTYIPINSIGLIVIGSTLFLEFNNLLTSERIIFLLVILVIVFITNMIYVFRDFKEEITETEARRRKKYLVKGILHEHFKIIKDETAIKNEIEKNKNIPIPERTQAFEMIKLGNQAFEQQNYKEALEKFDLSTNWVESGIGFLNQSGVLLKLGQYEDALVIAEKGAEVKSDFYEAYINQGVALEKLEQYESALEKFKIAAELCPDEYDVWYCQGDALFKLGKLEEAIPLYDKSLQLYGKQFEAWYHKGIALQKIKKEVEALRSFDQAIKLKPNHAKVHYRAGNILCRLNRDDEAIAAYEKSIRLNADYVQTWNNLGITLNKIGRTKDAIKCYERAIKINPKYFEAWLNKALALDSTGQHKKAFESYKKFLELAPNDLEKRRQITRKRIDELKNKFKKKGKKQFSLFKLKKKPKTKNSANKSMKITDIK